MRSAVGAVVAAIAWLNAGTAFGQKYPGSFYFVQGMLGTDLGTKYPPTLPVDVEVILERETSGYCLLSAQQFGSNAGPYPLPDGHYKFRISVSNPQKPCSNGALMETLLPIVGSRQVAVVAAEAAGPAPAVEILPTGESARVGHGVARALVCQTANAPAVDVSFLAQHTRKPKVLKDIAFGLCNSLTLLPFVSYTITVSATGGGPILAGPLYVDPFGRTLNAIYVVGSASNNTVTIATKVVPGIFPGNR
jgi:hypothetical protein